MSATQMTLPPISLADLPERTKDYLIAVCNQDGLTPAEALKLTLDRAAARAGFLSLPNPQPEGDQRELALVG